MEQIRQTIENAWIDHEKLKEQNTIESIEFEVAV